MGLLDRFRQAQREREQRAACRCGGRGGKCPVHTLLVTAYVDGAVVDIAWMPEVQPETIAARHMEHLVPAIGTGKAVRLEVYDPDITGSDNVVSIEAPDGFGDVADLALFVLRGPDAMMAELTALWSANARRRDGLN